MAQNSEKVTALDKQLPTGWTVRPPRYDASPVTRESAWRIDDDHVLELVPIGHTDDRRIRWAYRLTRRNQTIFTGEDFGSAADAEPTARTYIAAAAGLLGFLTLRPGDTDAEFFADYSPAQTAWCDEHAEELSVYAMDRDCGYCGGRHDSPACRRRFTHSHARLVAKAVGPRVVGGRYWSGYWGRAYTVTAITTASTGSMSWSISVRWDHDGHTGTHASRWNPKRDFILADAPAPAR